MKEFGKEKKKEKKAKQNKERNLLWFSGLCVLCVSPRLPEQCSTFSGLTYRRLGHGTEIGQRSLRSLSTSVDAEGPAGTEALGNGRSTSWEGAWVPAGKGVRKQLKGR